MINQCQAIMHFTFFSGWGNLSYLAIFVFEMDVDVKVSECEKKKIEREKRKWRKMRVGVKHRNGEQRKSEREREAKKKLKWNREERIRKVVECVSECKILLRLSDCLPLRLDFTLLKIHFTSKHHMKDYFDSSLWVCMNAIQRLILFIQHISIMKSPCFNLTHISLLIFLRCYFSGCFMA